MSKKQYLKEILSELTKISREDSNILCLFVHGSVVYKTVTYKNYQEIMLFEDHNFLGSVFRLQKINPDIDMVCVSADPEKTNGIILDRFKKVNSFFLTMNIMTPDVFEREVSSESPNAIKRILAKRRLSIIKSAEYVSRFRKIAKENLSKLDINFQKEYEFRKEYLKLHIRNDKESFIMPLREYERLFPLFTKFIKGELSAGFPPNRIKLVLPKPMNLKAKLDIIDCKTTYLE